MESRRSNVSLFFGLMNFTRSVKAFEISFSGVWGINGFREVVIGVVIEASDSGFRVGMVIDLRVFFIEVVARND